jgi:hypothetical protein
LRLILPPGPLPGLAVLSVFCALVGQAAAQEYCVACTQPPGTYRCIIEGARPGGSQPLQMLCITTMAKQGGHGACSVKGGTVFDCNGPVKRIPWTALSEPGQPEQDTVKAPTGQSPPKDPTQPPQTVEEMAKRANQKSAEQAKALGESVGDATKKTWRCISSFFTRCKE